MTTNLHYLIAGMAVLLVVLWQYSHQRQMDDRNSLMFRRLLTVVSLDVLAELVSTCFILYAPYSFGVGRMLSNTVFYLFQAILPLMLLYYVCTLCSSRVISTGTVLRMGIPTIALVFIILTNPFTEKLFYFDSTGYCHGPWYLLLYISALLHIAAAAIFVAVHRDAVSRRNLTALLAVFLLAAFGIAAQAVNPAVLTTGFGLSLSILAMYLTINNPCACMDSLTGLNDKQYLLRRMNELTDAHKAFHIITVYAYQLDHMNKVSGVQSGDEFLRRAAEHMQEIAGRNVFRVTGKRFLLLTFSLREYEACLTSLRQVFHTQPDDAQAAPSPVILCGVVGAEKLGTGGLVLDYAEYLESLAARSGGTEVIQNDRKNRDSFYYNKQVEQFLHRAIDEDLFEVYYQPVYSLHQQRFVTLEALSRLRHPTLGWIAPDIFIRLAEKNRLISQITELQLRRVCRFLRENPALRASIANVKINLSPLDLIHSDGGSHLIRILDEYGLPYSCFQFEITETVATEYSASLTRVAESFQAAGIGLCLDDFGSGYANLNTVMQLPFSVIKLDRSLLFHICTDKNAALFYQSIVSAFCRLGYRIIAEGVETQEEMELERGHDSGLLFLPSSAAGRPAAAADRGSRRTDVTGCGGPPPKSVKKFFRSRNLFRRASSNREKESRYCFLRKKAFYMKKTLIVFACTALLAASLSACGSKPAENTDTGTASSAAASSSSSEQQQENTLTGSLDEKKNGMFVVTDAEGAAYEFTYDPSDTPKGLDDAAEGDSVTVTYTGTVSEVDSFDGTIISVEKAEAAQN